jgi:hypothetical protein
MGSHHGPVTALVTALRVLVLIVDQFEQVFTLNPDLGGQATRQAFITALCSAAANPVGPGLEPPALVVIAVRGDFWDRCAAVPELASALQDGQFLYSQLADAAVAWHDSDDDPSFLYRGAQLAALQQAVVRWSANPTRSPVLTGTQRDFLQASARATVRSSRLRRGAFAVLALLTVLAVAASGLAFSQRGAAIRQRDQAIYNQLIAEALQFGTSNPTFAAQLTLAAYRIRPTQDLASRLLNTENTPLSSPIAAGTAGVNSVAFSAAGHTLASGNSGGIIRLWDVADTARPRPLGSIRTGAAAVDWVAFGPDGRTLASGSLNGAIRLWDITDIAHPRPLGQPLTGSTAAVGSVAFGPDEHTLASGSLDGATRLWNLNAQYAIDRICAAAGGLTPRQWNQYIPQLRYQSSCAG